MHNRSNGQVTNIRGTRVLAECERRATVFRKTGNRYLHLPTERVIDRIGRALEDRGISYDVDIKPANGHKTTKHYIEFTMYNETEKQASRSDGFFRIGLWASYNGESSVIMNGGFFRLVCLNGMMAGTSEEVIRFQHRQRRDEDMAEQRLDDIYYGAVALLDKQLDYASRFQLMEEVPTTFEEETKIVMDLDLDNGVKAEVINLRQESTIGALRPEDQPRNMWTLLNTVNEQLRLVEGDTANVMEKNIELTTQFVEVARQLAA